MKRITSWGLATTIGAVLGVFLVCAPASAATLGGTATIADPSTNQPLASGSSTTSFTVTLPANAACSGDTATDGYHVYSYLVQKGTPVTGVTFVNFPSTGYGLVDNTGTYYGKANAAITTGQIIGIPNDFQWGPLVTTDGGSLAVSQLLYSGSSGVWEAGLACANSSGTVTDYWNTEVTFTSSSSDPNGFTWAAVPGVPSQTPEVAWAVALPVLGIGVLGAGVAVSRRRAGRRSAIARDQAAR
jgi:hypothetical protein